MTISATRRPTMGSGPQREREREREVGPGRDRGRPRRVRGHGLAVVARFHARIEAAVRIAALRSAVGDFQGVERSAVEEETEARLQPRPRRRRRLCR
jgi:hypothetical protein